ncbi:hypothetical protein [Microvirga thermotolerans]|uniref:Uncharacterized protein n=1 Tax=Microvirga thermotolerans TaxID=2651334 RepID=A0A5P9K1A2_9HYPH|nr:hypothetical protein [Microvirga thermotolerans]QFU17706.1 hypothetical protein GDR74_16625 [Microvirga thermotolerans]
MAGPVRTRRLFKFDASAVRDEYELDFEDFAGRRTKLVLTADQLQDLTERLSELLDAREHSIFSKSSRKLKA